MIIEIYDLEWKPNIIRGKYSTHKAGLMDQVLAMQPMQIFDFRYFWFFWSIYARPNFNVIKS